MIQIYLVSRVWYARVFSSVVEPHSHSSSQKLQKVKSSNKFSVCRLGKHYRVLHRIFRINKWVSFNIGSLSGNHDVKCLNFIFIHDFRNDIILSLKSNSTQSNLLLLYCNLRPEFPTREGSLLSPLIRQKFTLI